MLAIALIIGANAQQNSSVTDDVTKPFYKFYKGSVATELNFSLLSGGSTGSFTMPELRLRFGLSDKFALRVKLGLDFGHDKTKRNLDDVIESNWSKAVIEGNISVKNNYTKFSIAPGVEYHFGKWERMSIYVGCEIPVGFYVTKSISEENSKTMIWERSYNSNELTLRSTVENSSYLKTKNCSSGYICDPWGCHYTYQQTGRISFGINAFAGFDFYVYKGLYLGAELGLGCNYSIALKGSVKGDNTTITTLPGQEPVTKRNEIDEKFDDKITGGYLGFRCNPMIRLGWKF